MSGSKIKTKGTDLQSKIGRIITLLESDQGIPTWNGPSDPLESLVLTVLSQNTNDRNRDRAYESLRSAFPTWDGLALASARDISRAIRVGGLANQKGRRLKALLGWVKVRFGGWDMSEICGMDMEEAIDLLVSVDGVGVKTAAVVLMFACGRDVFPVDTHVHRLCLRLGLVAANSTAEKTFMAMKDMVPPGKSYSLHMNLIHFGRNCCRARIPVCLDCPLYRECLFPGKTKERPSR
ncbi:endonuclease III domain-containing protein [candidate division KSB1 bacterium]